MLVHDKNGNLTVQVAVTSKANNVNVDGCDPGWLARIFISDIYSEIENEISKQISDYAQAAGRIWLVPQDFQPFDLSHFHWDISSVEFFPNQYLVVHAWGTLSFVINGQLIEYSPTAEEGNITLPTNVPTNPPGHIVLHTLRLSALLLKVTLFARKNFTEI